MGEVTVYPLKFKQKMIIDSTLQAVRHHIEQHTLSFHFKFFRVFARSWWLAYDVDRKTCKEPHHRASHLPCLLLSVTSAARRAQIQSGLTSSSLYPRLAFSPPHRAFVARAFAANTFVNHCRAMHLYQKHA